jgi:ATP-binding cassette subfamily B protein
MWHGGGQGTLPFAGIPKEVARRAARLMAGEPDWGLPEVPFSLQASDQPRFTLRVLLAPRRWALLGALLLVAVETVLLQAGPLLTKVGIDAGILDHDFGVVVAAGAGYALSVGLGGLATGARVAWTARVAAALAYDLRVRVFAHVQRLSLDFFSQERSGRVMTRMTNDIESMNQMLQNALVQIAVQGLTALVVAGLLFALDWELAVFTMTVVVPAMLALSIWFRSASERGYRRVRDGIADVLADLAESLAGIRVVAAFNRAARNVLQHRRINRTYRDAEVYTAHVTAVYGPATTALGLVAQVLIVLVGSFLVVHRQLSVGSLAAFVLYMTSFFAPLQQLVQLYSTYQAGQAAVAKLAGLLAVRPTVVEATDAVELPPVRGEVVFDRVWFAYGAHPVLKDVSFRVEPGRRLALVGATGAGKSTIAKLLVRLYDPGRGRITIDGHDLRSVTLGSLRRQLGVVPQEAFLFAGSVRDNVAFGRPEATDAEVLGALRAVGLEGLLERLPRGLDTPVRERGVALSSGERQLLALARAFLVRPRILVLDEATSNLDLASEARVEAALDAVLVGRTAILVAHRLSTAMRADTIAVVEGGRIVEMGSHAELVTAEGAYARLHRTWMRHLEGAATAAKQIVVSSF